MNENISMTPGPAGYIAVLPNTIIEIPKSSNLSWLPMFYALPPELVGKRPEYAALPRNIHVLLASPECIKLIESDVFLELVWDCYAWAIWQFIQIPLKNGTYRDIPGTWSNYSGDFPLWRFCYYMQLFFREKYEAEMGFSFQQLFLMPSDQCVPWLDYRHFGNLVGNLTDLIVKEQNLQPFIDAVWQNRQVEDYADDDNLARKDFIKHWTHVRSDSGVKEILSLEETMESNEDVLHAKASTPDISGDIINQISIEEFMKELSDEDRLMLKLRAEGKTLGEIASALGVKSPSAVTKRIARIADRYRDEVG